MCVYELFVSVFWCLLSLCASACQCACVYLHTRVFVSLCAYFSVCAGVIACVPIYVLVCLCLIACVFASVCVLQIGFGKLRSAMMDGNKTYCCSKILQRRDTNYYV